MALITEEVEVDISGRIQKWYIDKGYHIPKVENNIGLYTVPKGTKILVNVKDLPNSSNVYVKYKCDNCDSISDNIKWQDYKRQVHKDEKTYCNLCANKLYGWKNRKIKHLSNGTTFDQWCIDNDEKHILDRWDYELNSDTPKDITYGSQEKRWFKCSLGLHTSEPKRIKDFTSGHSGSMDCKACNSFGQHLISTYGKTGIENYWGDKNKESPFEIPYGREVKVWIRCQRCKNEKLIVPRYFTRQGLGCPKCSDGISYPNKIAFNLLEQLGIDFTSEYSPNWIKPKRYDFYFKLNNKKYIIEMDGGFHGIDNKMNGQTAEETKIIDDYKNKLALEHNIEVIRIDCELSDIEYIRENILDSKLRKILNLQIINWQQCHEFACSSLIKVACELWNHGIYNSLEIAKKLNLGRTTIIGYLKKGSQINLCNYNAKEEKIQNYKNKSIKIYCLELNVIFESMSDVQRRLNIDSSSIRRCCNGRQKTAGGYHWMYYEDYLKLHNETNELNETNLA